MIRSFRDPDTERLCRSRSSVRFAAIAEVTLRKLDALTRRRIYGEIWGFQAIASKKLKGIRSRQHSIRINDQWRLCFIWKDGDAYEVEITDYR